MMSVYNGKGCFENLVFQNNLKRNSREMLSSQTSSTSRYTDMLYRRYPDL